MKRALAIAVAATVLSLLAAPSALATTQTAQSGNVSATFTFSGSYPNFTGLHLSIAQGGTVYYDEPVASKLCGTYCAPGSAVGQGILGARARPRARRAARRRPRSVQRRRPLLLDRAGVLVRPGHDDLHGDPARLRRPGEQIVDLGHNGRYEFLTADDAFAYEFTDFAASGLPIQILTFSNRRFLSVTRHYPKLIARDAARWLKAFNSMAKQHYSDSVGVVAAWAADEELLGHVEAREQRSSPTS